MKKPWIIIAIVVVVAAFGYFAYRHFSKAEKLPPRKTKIAKSKYNSKLDQLPDYAIYNDTMYYFSGAKFIKIDLESGSVAVDKGVSDLLAQAEPNRAEFNNYYVENITVDDNAIYLTKYKPVVINRKSGELQAFDRTDAWQWELDSLHALYALKGYENSAPEDVDLRSLIYHQVRENAVPSDSGLVLWEDAILEFTSSDKVHALMEDYPGLPDYPEIKYPHLAWATTTDYIVYSNDVRNKFYRIGRSSHDIEDEVDLSAFIKAPTRAQRIVSYSFLRKDFSVRRANGHYYVVYLEKGLLQVVRFDL